MGVVARWGRLLSAGSPLRSGLPRRLAKPRFGCDRLHCPFCGQCYNVIRHHNAELYSRVGVPFVMGTTGGDREVLYKTVHDSGVISPQMGKQVVAFLATMEIMAAQFPGAFSGYSLEVMESHQSTKLDTSGTAKAVISCFQKLGVS